MTNLSPLPTEVRELLNLATIYLSLVYPDCYFEISEEKVKQIKEITEIQS